MIKTSLKKNLLTTASALALGSVLLPNAALSAAQAIGNSTVAVSAGATLSLSTTGAVGTVADGINFVSAVTGADGKGTLTFAGDSTVSGTVGVATTGDLLAINAGAAGKTVTFSDDVAALTTTVTGTGTIAFGGSLTGDLVYGDDGVVTLAAGEAITGDITTGTAGEGTLEFLGAGTMTGAIGVAGGSELKLVTINAGAVTASADVAATTINFAGDGSLEMANGTELEGAVTTATTNTGTLTFAQAGTMTGDVGTSTALLKLLTVGGTTAGTVAATGNIYATTVDFQTDATLTIVGGKTIGGKVTTDDDGQGTITVDATAGDTTISGLIGTSNVLDLKVLNHDAGADGDVLTLGGTGTNYIATTNIGAGQVALSGSLEGNVVFASDAGATGALTVASGSTVTGAVTAADAGEGTVTFSGAATLTGSLGVAGASELALVTVNSGAVTSSGDIAATTINFAGDGSLAMADGTELEGAVTTATTNTGTVSFAGTSGTITGDVGASAKVLKLLSVDTTGTLTTTGDIYATTVTFEGTDDGTLEIANGKTLTAATTTDTTNTGTLSFAQGGTIAGNVGTSSKVLKLLTIDSGNNNGATVTVSSGDIYATTVNFVGDSTLSLADNSDVTGAITATDTEGAITILGTSTITGKVGTSVAEIGTINVDSTDSSDIVTFTDDVYVTEFDATGSNATVMIGAGKKITDADGITAAEAGNVTYNFGITEASAGDSIGQLVSEAGAIDLTNSKIAVTVSAASEYIAAGNTYIVADSAAAGTAPTITTVTDNSYALSFTASLSGNDVIVTAARANTYQSSSTKVNESAVGAALETIAGNGDTGLNEIQGALQNMATSREVERALETLNPEMSGAINAAAVSAAESGFGVVGNRLDQLAGISGTGVAAGGMSYNSGVWGEVFGTAADQDDRNGVKGYQADTIGFGIGADTAVGEDTKVGASFAYASTEADSANGETEIDSYQVSLYGTKDYGKWFSDGLLGFTFNNFDTTRNIVVASISDQAKADFDGQQYTLKVGGGYKLDVEGGLNVTPVASLKYNYLKLDKYTETGSSANLTVDNEDIHSLKSDIGVKLNYPIVDGSMTYIPEISTSWSYDLIGDEQEAKNNFVGAASTQFTTKGAKVAQHQFNVGLGLDVLAQDNVTVSFDYDWASKEDYNSHSGAVKARFAF